VQLGIRQARYVGTTKTLFQLAMAAAVANLVLLANRTGDRVNALGSGLVAGSAGGASGLLALLGAFLCRPTAPNAASACRRAHGRQPAAPPMGPRHHQNGRLSAEPLAE
jgi:hypothetical protein